MPDNNVNVIDKHHQVIVTGYTHGYELEAVANLVYLVCNIIHKCSKH